MTTLECIIIDCKRYAIRGKWCGEHWTELWERDLDILRNERPEYLARQLLQARRIIEFLADDEWAFCTCGHLRHVHSWGGCHGVTGSDLGGWMSCDCEAYEDAASA